MLVSWKWLSKYVDLPSDRSAVEDRLSLTGLNHEGTEPVGDDDFCVDLEVTSNRGDCLGHIGVAREISVLYETPLKRPEPVLNPSKVKIDSLLSVENRFTEACPRYTARVIQGVKIGPSPDWMVEALESIGMGVVNNVVDVTNYVMMECGQPLHAFDYAKVAGQKIIVRPANDGEIITAIDHKDYPLDPSMCVIADANVASAVAGVMGGADSEVDENTVDLVIEAAEFTPLSVRRAARKLKLHSPSSFRFERRVDPVGIQWASRRACELICELAGGQVADGTIDTAPDIPAKEPIPLRLSQLERILGITIEPETVSRILKDLGCTAGSGESSYIPPTWRHDLTREADLIEEVARIHGYEKIPEDAPIPVVPSSKREFDIAMERVRSVMVTAGLSEAMTPSVVTKKLDESLSPWTDRPALETQTAMLKGSKRLRRTLMPSLLQARANNWASASVTANLFEIAHIYLPGKTTEDLPEELYTLGMVSSGDFFALKGVLEKLFVGLGIEGTLSVAVEKSAGFVPGKLVRVQRQKDKDTTDLGFLGVVDPKTLKQWKLPGEVCVAELNLPQLLELASLVPQQRLVSMFPSVQRDLNFIVAESVRWSELESVVRAAVGESLADVAYRETYRDAERDGKDRKRVLLSVELQKDDATLSGDEADALIQAVIGACKEKLSAELLS